MNQDEPGFCHVVVLADPPNTGAECQQSLNSLNPPAGGGGGAGSGGDVV